MLVMTGPRRELSITQSAQLAAQDLFGHRQAVFVEHPLRQIDQSPANDLMNRRGRTGFDHGDERAPLCVIEQARTSGRFAIDEPVRPLGVEPKHPIAKGLKTDPSKPGRVSPRAAIVNRNESQKPPRDDSRFFGKDPSPKHRSIKIFA
jgi:hypothetical protein